MTEQRIEVGPRYAQAVASGPLVFLAGQVADNWDADFQEQCRQVFARIDRLLADSGSGKHRLVSMQVWITEMQNYGAFNELYDAWIDPAAKPARATVRADLIDPRLLVEVMVVAAR